MNPNQMKRLQHEKHPFALLMSAVCLFALLIQAIRKAGIKKALWQARRAQTPCASRAARLLVNSAERSIHYTGVERFKGGLNRGVNCRMTPGVGLALVHLNGRRTR